VNGVLHTALQMIEKGATHLGVATDHVVESFRNGCGRGTRRRKVSSRRLLRAIQPLEEALAAMGVAVWADGGARGDDGLASAAHRLPQRTSAWRRFASGRRTRTSRSASWRARGASRSHLTEDPGRGAVGRSTASSRGFIPDFLALVGDSADGYHGIRASARWAPRAS
jgi:hypothetical protein